MVLWTLALLAYANSFRAGLVFDNRIAIAQDARIRAASSADLHLILTQDYWYQSSTSSLYRPLTTLSYLFNYAILGNGISPAGYHWLNLALHDLNIALVYLLSWMLFAEFWPAFALAALWAIHPVLTESVTNIVGRADLLAAFGVLAGLLCYARSVTAGRRGPLWLLALMAAAAVGVFSKESGIVVLGAIFLYDLAWCRAVPLRRRAAGYLAAAVPVVIYLLVRSSVLANVAVADMPFTDNPLVGAGFFASHLTAVKVIGRYLCLLVWPGQLSCDYSYNQIPVRVDWQAALAVLVCAAAVVVAVLCFRRVKPVFFFLFFFFVTLAPTANLVLLIGAIMAERFLYLPSIGILGCLVWAAWAVHRRLSSQSPSAKFAVPTLAAMVCLAFCARTFARNADWFDERSLWSSAVESAPQSYKAHHHLASALLASGNGVTEEAVREIERSVAILAPLPDEQKVPAVYALAGYCYRVRGDYRRALDVLRTGRKADEAWYRDLVQRNSRDGKTIALSGWTPLYLELGRTYRALGDFAHSLEALAYGQQINPQIEFFEETAATYRAMGDGNRAAVALLEGITMGAGDQMRLAAQVMDVYRQFTPQSCAVSGNSLNFACPLVRDHLCAAAENASALYRRMHRDSAAAATAGGAIRSLGCPADSFR